MMKKSNKAALLSAIVFPGAGLWWLKHYWRACIFIIPASLSLWYIVKILYQLISNIMSKLQREAEEGLIDTGIANMTNLYTKLYADIHHSMATHQSQLSYLEVILVVCWLCSIASSYFAGKKVDEAEAVTNK